jgi:hypothetical protein
MAGKLSGVTSALSEGVERLERVILTVKARQLTETRNAPVLKSTPDGFGFSPDEIWSKNYMTVGIGPAVRRPPGSAGASTAYRLPEQPVAAAKVQPPLTRSPPGANQPGTIGEALAKPAPRRSWLGRLVRGR